MIYENDGTRDFVYNYDDDGCYTTTTKTRISEADGFCLLPRNATFISIPEYDINTQIPRFVDGQWYLDDKEEWSKRRIEQSNGKYKQNAIDQINTTYNEKVLNTLVDFEVEGKTILEHMLQLLVKSKTFKDTESIEKLVSIIEEAKQEIKIVKDQEDPLGLKNNAIL